MDTLGWHLKGDIYQVFADAIFNCCNETARCQLRPQHFDNDSDE